MISLTINGQTLQVSENSTVLQAAEKAGIVIPTLCNHKDLTPYGGCRLCVVEVQGARLPSTSCTTPVSPGMVVQTETPTITRYRRAVLELLLSDFYDAGYTRTNGTTGIARDTQFSYWVNYYGIDMEKAMAKKPVHPIDSDPNPFVWVDKNKCILCTRCVRACAEIQGRFVWSQAYRGYKTHIVAGANSTMLQSRCESCGACVAYCPTGALDNKMSVSLGRPDRLVTTTCSYCSVGCQLALNIKDDVSGGRVLRVTSDPKAPVNGMHLCLKGRYGYDYIHSPNRLTQPRVRKYLLDGSSRPKHHGPWVDVDWDTALNTAASGLLSVKKRYGPDKLGFLASGICLNEENYLLNKLARQVIGTNNIDCSSHLFHASTVDGLSAAYNIAAQSNSLDDIANCAQSMLIIGSNVTEQHPVFGARIRQAVLRRGLKLVVAHPDFINISEYAALRLVYRPQTEMALTFGLMHIILKKSWEDRDFIANRTKGFDEFKQGVDDYPPDRVAKITGVPEASLYQAAEILAKNHPMAVIWSVDLAHRNEGSQNVTSLTNLQLLLGNVGIPGGGVNPLRSQNNSQGACDMGCLPYAYPGYQPVDSDEIRFKFESAWGTDLSNIVGINAFDMVGTARENGIEALFILGEDLIGCATGNPEVRRRLDACDLVILQGSLFSETSNFADILLPGVSFAEKSGTFTNTERRIQMVNQAIEPIGTSRPDWQILADLARRILASHERIIGNGLHIGWEYRDTSQIMAEAASLTPIYAGVSHERLGTVDRLQWPVENSSHPGTPIMHVDRFGQGLGNFLPCAPDTD